MKVIINSNQKGLLFKNGILQDFLGAGKYRASGSKSIEILPLDEEICSKNATVSQILTKVVNRYNADDLTSEVTVKNGEVALHYIDGVFANALTAGGTRSGTRRASTNSRYTPPPTPRSPISRRLLRLSSEEGLSRI